MFIKLTLAADQREIWIRAVDVKSIEKAPSGPKGEIQFGSYVGTTLITPQGPFAYHVKESPSEIAEAAAKVLRTLAEEDNKAKAHAISLARADSR